MWLSKPTTLEQARTLARDGARASLRALGDGAGAALLGPGVGAYRSDVAEPMVIGEVIGAVQTELKKINDRVSRMESQTAPSPAQPPTAAHAWHPPPQQPHWHQPAQQWQQPPAQQWQQQPAAQHAQPGVICEYCNKPNHSAWQCRARCRDQDACYGCGNTGHWRRDCPLQPQDARHQGQQGRQQTKRRQQKQEASAAAAQSA